MKKIDFFVDMDIKADPRVKKTATALSEKFNVVVHSLKRGLINNNKVVDYNFKIKYMKINLPDYVNNFFLINYAMHLISFFFEALKSDGDIYYANDLDVFIPVWFAAKIKRKKIIYDTHEYYTEVKPKNSSKFKLILLKFLAIIEKTFMKYTDINITVCELFADTFAKQYKIRKPYVIKNVQNIVPYEKKDILRDELNIDKDDKIVIYLGFLCIGRGVDNVIDSIPYINENIKVILIGPTANDSDKLKITKKAKENKNLFYYGRVDQDKVFDYLHSADLGIIYYENTFFANNSLSNKIFDYMMAGLPTLAIAMSETKRIINEVSFGNCVEDIKPEKLGEKINEMFRDSEVLEKFKKNALYHSQNKYNWDIEGDKLLEIMKENNLS